MTPDDVSVPGDVGAVPVPSRHVATGVPAIHALLLPHLQTLTVHTLVSVVSHVSRTGSPHLQSPASQVKPVAQVIKLQGSENIKFEYLQVSLQIFCQII